MNELRTHIHIFHLSMSNIFSAVCTLVLYDGFHSPATLNVIH